jgi:UDP-N-acetyl-D-glucosamine dehydrogenase
MLKKNKFNISQDFFLAYSPERISPELKVKNNKIIYKLDNTPKICSGYSIQCNLLAIQLYKKITIKVVSASSLKIAEATKMIENVFRSINIGLVNELKMFFNKINLDINEVLDLADTKPFGFTKFVPGPGYGGHCIPLDPYYLYWLAKKNNVELKFIKISGLVNKQITNWIVNKITNFIRDKKIKLFNKKILILGVAYKKNIDDARESPALKIASKLKSKGYDFDYSDPYIKKISFGNKIKKSKIINSNLLKKFPIVLITTDHSKFDYDLITKEAKYIFDSRNVIKNRKENYFKV